MNRKEFYVNVQRAAEYHFKRIADAGEKSSLEYEMEFIKSFSDETALREVFAELIRRLKNSDNIHIMAGEIRETAEDMFNCGEVDGGLELAKTMADDYQREWVMIAGARALAEQGRGDESIEICDGIKDRDCRARALSAAGSVMAAAGDGRAVDVLHRAFDAALEMKESYDSIWVICETASSISELKKGFEKSFFDKALDALNSICNAAKRASGFRAIAESMSKAGDERVRVIAGLALESAESISDAAGKANTLAWVFATLRKSGDVRSEAVLGKAVSSAQLLSDVESQSRAYRWIASSLADSDDFENAASLAGGIRNSFFRNEALKDVILSAVKNEKYETAAEALAKILNAGPAIEAIKESMILMNKKGREITATTGFQKDAG